MVRQSVLVAAHQQVARAIEGPVYFVGQELPPIQVVLTYDTGGFVDMTQATNVRLEISRVRGTKNIAEIPGTTTGVNASKGEYRFEITGNPFKSPGRYIAQVYFRLGGKEQSSQPFIITVLERVPKPGE